MHGTPFKPCDFGTILVSQPLMAQADTYTLNLID